jgi:hypothetical protein
MRLRGDTYDRDAWLEEVFKALKIKRPQFDVKECIPTYIEVF